MYTAGGKGKKRKTGKKGRSGYTLHLVYINVYITVSHVQVYISNMLARYIFQQSWGGDQKKLTFRAEGFCISDSSLLQGKK